MPFHQYRYLRKSVEQEIIIDRIQTIQDINTGMNGNKKHMEALEKAYQVSVGIDLNEQSTENWQEKLKRFQR